ncbi:hypothetical protein FOFC_01809 [Fusarium oxysporum]|nr:hypothetical protein FOFC_01809 [Fusarium oxysporum]
MFTTLPDFTPRDSHSLWYRSSRSPYTPPGPLDDFSGDTHNIQHGANQARQRTKLIERSALARLAADEQYMQRRRLNVQNYGSGWLKPPGVPKTLHQMREEKREQEEHQEAMRREQLAQELAQAEAEGMPGEGTMDDVQLDGAQDLDDEIPDADEEGYAFGDDDDEDEDDDEEDDEEEDEEDGEETDDEALRAERQNDLMQARMRMGDDAFREALVRGEPDANDISEQESSNDDEDDDEDDVDVSFAPRSATLPRPMSPTFQGRSSMAHPRASMDLSNLLSQDGSSFMQSSPAGRRARHG